MFRKACPPDPQFPRATGPALARALSLAPEAEWGLVHDGAAVLLSRDGGSGWLTRRAGRRLVALGLHLGRPGVRALGAAARERGLSPFLYKCDARTAQAARRSGWHVLRLGHEAVLDLPGWSADRPACRQLRRKLRSKDAQALRIELAGELPVGAMRAVVQDWIARHGAERGFSMGRFDLDLLRRQRVLLAFQSDRLVAFASFHALGAEWTLDLMRHSFQAPDGTMHRLVFEAIGIAQVEGAERLSLAAIPEPAAARRPLGALGLSACGLAQFKKSFGPQLRPRYAAAPSLPLLAMGLARVAWAIHRPDRGHPATEAAARLRTRGSRPDLGRGWLAQFGFEPGVVPCDAPSAQPRPATVPSWDDAGLLGRPDR